MTTRYEKTLFALMVALVFAAVTFILVQAQGGNAPQPQTFTKECGTCHTEAQMAWANGLHGHATDDPVFEEAWTEQGKPGACLVCHTTGYDPQTATWTQDGVACEACHNPVPEDHPKSPMPVTRTTDLCGQCHSDTRFGWQDWKVSTHYQRNMTCTVCHDPHTAKIKEMFTDDGASASNDPSQLCITCHQEASMNFPYSTHHNQGLACVDCHVMHTSDDPNEIHTVPDHSFEASLKSCNNCHKDSMHGPGMASDEISGGAPLVVPDMPQVELASVTPEPQPMSPVGFAGLAGLIGLAAGMILAPWFERIYHKVNSHKGGK